MSLGLLLKQPGFGSSCKSGEVCNKFQVIPGQKKLSEQKLLCRMKYTVST